METVSFYRNVTIVDCNQQIDEEPLIVNCAGNCSFSSPFFTQNTEGRLDYYLQFVTNGNLYIVTNEKDAQNITIMKPGDFRLTAPKNGYTYFIPEGRTMEYMWVHFTGFYAGRLLSRLQIESGKTYSAAESIPQINVMFSQLFEELSNKRRGFDDACSSILTNILIHLSRKSATSYSATEKKLSSIAWLHRHFDEDTPISELAAMEHLSESRYRNVFKHRTGLSPGEYRIALRMQHACDLLSRSEQSIAEISNFCGYSDVLYFTRIFKQKIGIPPGEYRKAAKNN